jgi:peptidyl-tRNA hydrolase
MKEQTILEMKNKIEVLGKNIQGLMAQNVHLTELAIGTLEVVKLMPDYKEAIEALRIEMESKAEDKKLEV